MNTILSRIGGIRTEEDNTETILNAIQPTSLQSQIRQNVRLGKMANSSWTYEMTLKLATETEKMSPDNWDPVARAVIRNIVPPVDLPCRYCSDFGHDYQRCPDKHAGKPARSKEWYGPEERRAFKERNERKREAENNANQQIRQLKKTLKKMKEKPKGQKDRRINLVSDTLIARGILDKSQPQTIRVVRETSELVKIHSSKQKEKSFHFEFKGLVGTERVTFLNDTGCSTMVVGKDTLKRLNLPFQPRKVAPILVEYGNLQTETISEEISLAISIGNYFRKWTFYVADIGDMIILGNPFQDSIHVTDQLAKEGRYGFLDLYTQEPHCGLWKVTKRRLNYHASIPQLKLSRRKNFTNDSCTRGHVTIRLLSEEKNLPAANEPAEDPQITALLHEYAARFAEPKELPPERPGLDMEINLQPNSEIPKWRSIGKFNEAELEQLKRQIREMLERGHIRPSTSPFAASVLFAKKADGGLRCASTIEASTRLL